MLEQVLLWQLLYFVYINDYTGKAMSVNSLTGIKEVLLIKLEQNQFNF